VPRVKTEMNTLDFQTYCEEMTREIGDTLDVLYPNEEERKNFLMGLYTLSNLMVGDCIKRNII
jgi:hypothetical protein